MPPAGSFGANANQECFAWLGRAHAVITQWDGPTSILLFGSAADQLNSRFAKDVEAGVPKVITLLHRARHDLRLKTVGPLTVSVAAGAMFDYFDEVRKLVETAKTDLFFVDPYLDAEFVSRYLPHATKGVAVRLLGRQCLPVLLPAVSLMRQQSGANIEVRSKSGFHDRYLFIDGRTGYHSGASFKDGAIKAPTTLNEIVAAVSEVRSI